MLKKIFIVSNIVIFLGIFIYLGKTTFLKAANCTSNCTQKEIGTLGKDAFGRDVLNPVDPVAINKSYWVKLSVKGQDAVNSTGPTSIPSPSSGTLAGPSDIMLMLDTTTSMYNSIPVNKDGSGGTVLNYAAVRDGLVKMVSLSDETKDYLGFGSFRLCNQYSSASTPIWWTYEDWNRADGIYRGVSAIHLPLQPLVSRKQTFTDAINSITVLNDGSKNVNFCKSAGISGSNGSGFNGGTSVGAAITAADTQLTPILNDSKSVRRDGTSYRNSTQTGVVGYNDGPRTRPQVPKYIVLATDGGEGAPPTVDDQEFDKNLRSILQTAAFYKVKIYGIAFSNPGSSNYIKLQRIVSSTCSADGSCGKIFNGTSRQAILESIEAIRNDITITSQGTPPPSPSPSFSATGSTAIITERINSTNFSVANLTTTSFKLIKRNADGSVTDITSVCGAGLAICLTSKDAGGFDLKLPSISAAEEIAVYFMVTPTTPSAIGTKVPVDRDPDSIVKYSNGYQENIRNVQVGVVANKPYFETQNGGDVHTQGGLLVDMPDANKFMRGTSPGILSFSGSATVRPNNNQLSSKNWKVGTTGGYSVNAAKYSYSAMLATIKNITPISRLSDITGSGFYSYSGDVTIDAINKLPNLKTNSMQITLFVSGNVYIKTAIDIFGNVANKSSLSIISAKNIGISTAIKDSTNGVIDGIYIADGVIDTACNSTFSFTQCAPGAPAFDPSSLTLEGMFLGRVGFNLDRLGQPEIPTAGEKFIYKPELLLTAAPQLGSLSSVWREVTP